jgi:hypothetical protein
MTKETTADQIRSAAHSSLETFILLVSPQRLLAAIHVELIEWITRQDKKRSQLVLLPRDHAKSTIAAFYVAWQIMRRPDIRVLLISSTANLAEKQLKFIKDVLTSDIFTTYWPGYIHREEGKREKWTNNEISIDHPQRKFEGIRDPTVFTGGLTTSLTGMHADLVVLDDVVVQENAYTKEGREKVMSQYSLLHSIAGADSEELVVGTRYHPKDLYQEMQDITSEEYNPEGEIIGRHPVYEIFQRQVEDRGDGAGTFLWPRQQRGDGKWFGFNQQILSEKRAKYLDRTQFRAQYYNSPEDATNSPISREKFQYFERRLLSREEGRWFYKGRRLNVYASIDFAYSLGKKSDYTALVVIGIDFSGVIYILDIGRIKTDRISEYYILIRDLHVKWEFRKLRAETSGGQQAIVKELKSQYITPNGLHLAVEEFKPNSKAGTKEERMHAILEPRYANLSILHYKGGDIHELEEELVHRNPRHDDIKDALSSCIEIAVPPAQLGKPRAENVLQFNPRFGGVT